MNAMRLNAMCWMFAARGLAVLWPITIAATAAPAITPPPIPFPSEYRSWQHVRTIVVSSEHRSFATRGGIHHYYANAKAVEGYRSGQFPNGSVIVDEGVLTQDGTGPMKGVVMEGDRRTLDVMVRNDRLYADTGGWGFEHFEGTEATGQLQADVKRRTQCYECHSKSESGTLVFSKIRMAKFAPPPTSDPK